MGPLDSKLPAQADENERGTYDGGTNDVDEFFIEMVVINKLEVGKQRLGKGRCDGPWRGLGLEEGSQKDDWEEYHWDAVIVRVRVVDPVVPWANFHSGISARDKMR